MAQGHFTTRRLESMGEFAQLVDLQRNHSDIDGKYIIAEKVFHVLSGEGGAVLGLYDEQETLRGFSVHFPCLQENKTFARIYRMFIEPGIPDNGLALSLLTAQRKLVDSLNLSSMKFEVPVLPFNRVNEALTFAGAFGEEFLPAIPDGSTDTDSILISWPSDAKKFSIDETQARNVLETIEVSGEILPGKGNLDIQSNLIGVPVPDKKIWKRLNPESIKVWKESIRRILQHYISRGYILVAATPAPEGNGCPQYILSNSLI